MNIKKIISRLVLTTLMFFVGLSFFACKKASDKVPYGDIGDKEVFTASYGGKTYSVTEKDLYKDFRRQAADTLNRLIETKSLASQVKNIDLKDNDHRKFLVKYLNKTVLGTDDEKKLQFSDAANLYQSLMKFVSSHSYPSYYDINLLKEKLIEIIDKNPADRNFTYDGDEYNELLMLGALQLAKKIYAKEVLEKLVDNKKDKNYIKDDKEASKNDYLTKFKNSEKNNYGVSFFAVDFTSEDELNQILYNLRDTKPIKISSNGTWYYVPDIRKMSLADINKPEYKYLKEYIEKDLLTKKLDITKYKTLEDVMDGKIDDKGFTEYMTSYKIDANRKDGNKSDEEISKNDDHKKTILEILIKIYNTIHDRYEDQLTLEGDNVGNFKIKHSNGDDYKTTFTAEEMKKHLLKSELYDTLKFNYKKEGENYEPDLKKSKLVLERLTKVYGNSNGGGRKYLIFKFREDKKRLELNKIFDYSKNEFVDAKDDATKKALADKKAQLKKDIIEDKLTQSYIDTTFKDYLKDKNLSIYDPLQRISFQKKKIEYSKTNLFKNNDVIATINDTDITVREFYNELLAQVGINLAVNKIYNEVVKTKYLEKVTKEDKDAIYHAIKNDLANFSRGYNKNYDAQIGRDLYLQHAYGVTSFNEALEKAYADKAKEYFSKDMPRLFGGDTNDKEKSKKYYKDLAKIAGEYYKKAFSLKVQHLLFSVDDDLDGNPDNPASLSESRRAEIENALRPLTAKLKIEESKGLKNLIKNLDEVIAEYVKASRYVKTRDKFTSDEDYEKYTKSGDYIYGNLKKAGISIKKEDIKEKITEKSFEKYDKVFFERCKFLYDKFKDSKEFPQADLIQEYGFAFGEIRSSFGWHQVIVESVEKPKSAKTNKDYTSKIKNEGDDLKVAKNEKDEVQPDQVEVYLRESNEKKYTVEVEGKEAIKAQLDPVLSRINTAGEFGILLLFHIFKMKKGTYEVKDELMKKTFEIYKETSVNRFNNFAWRKLPDGKLKIYNKEYCKLWTNWDNDKQEFTKDFLAEFDLKPFE